MLGPFMKIGYGIYIDSVATDGIWTRVRFATHITDIISPTKFKAMKSIKSTIIPYLSDEIL